MSPSARRLLACFAALALAAMASPVTGARPTPEPGRTILGETGLELSKLRELDGDPVVVELDVADDSREAAFVGLIRIDGSGETLFEDDAFDWAALLDSPRAIGRLDGEGGDGLGELELPEKDLDVLEDCRPGRCKFKLDAAGIETAQEIDWDRQDAETRFVRWFRDALDRKVERYREAGLEGLITYVDKPEPFPVARGVERVESQAAPLLALFPDLRGYLDAYPTEPPDGVRDRLEWSIAGLGFRDTLSVDHVVVSERRGEQGLPKALARRTIYANHYLAGRLQIVGVIDGPSVFGIPGRFVMTVDHILFDDEVGGFKRMLLGDKLSDKVEDRLTAIRSQAGRGGGTG